jgi:hypothetical protein
MNTFKTRDSQVGFEMRPLCIKNGPHILVFKGIITMYAKMYGIEVSSDGDISVLSGILKTQ